jgi:hypothetical protein
MFLERRKTNINCFLVNVRVINAAHRRRYLCKFRDEIIFIAIRLKRGVA